jgi:hypothetical protein
MASRMRPATRAIVASDPPILRNTRDERALLMGHRSFVFFTALTTWTRSLRKKEPRISYSQYV